MALCMPGVEKGSTIIEGADAFLFSGGYIHTYNNYISVSVPFDAGGFECSIRAAAFYKLIQKILF